MVLEQLDIQMQKKKNFDIAHTICKICLKIDCRYKCKSRTIEFPGENICDLG